MKICSKEHCQYRLRNDNKSGYCKKHRYLSEGDKSSRQKWQKRNADKVAENHRKWVKANREKRRNSDRKRSIKNPNRWRKWQEENREKLNAKNRKWREKNQEKVQISNQKWRKENPELVRLNNKKSKGRRRAREKEAFIEDVDCYAVWRRDSGLCFLCGFPANEDNWWLEHIIPLSRGGLHCYENVAVSHPSCNQRKTNKLLEELFINDDDIIL